MVSLPVINLRYYYKHLHCVGVSSSLQEISAVICTVRLHQLYQVEV
jgi:hypothetical protein